MRHQIVKPLSVLNSWTIFFMRLCSYLNEIYVINEGQMAPPLNNRWSDKLQPDTCCLLLTAIGVLTAKALMIFKARCLPSILIF